VSQKCWNRRCPETGVHQRLNMVVPLALAPMAGVSDLPFRLLARECGADVTITEFTSSAGLSRDVANSWLKVESDSREKPFIPQIFGGDKDEMVQTVKMLQDKADLIDLNFGCPAPKVTRICAGAALMGEPEELVAIVDACIDASDVPISAKLRMGTGYLDNNIVELAPRLEESGIFRLCVHGRTLKQKYDGKADWDTIRQVVEEVDIPVFANGDVVDADSAQACLDATGADGLMIGRGAIGRPMVFHDIKTNLNWDSSPPPWGLTTNPFAIRSWCWNRYVVFAEETTGLQRKWLNRHAVAFTKGLEGAKHAREILTKEKDPEKMAAGISKWLSEGSEHSES